MEVKVSIPHNLTQDEAKTKAEPVMVECLEAFNGQDIESEWDGHNCKFSCTSLGFKVSGVAEICENVANITVDLPLAASMFKGRVKEAVTKKLTKAFS